MAVSAHSLIFLRRMIVHEIDFSTVHFLVSAMLFYKNNFIYSTGVKKQIFCILLGTDKNSI